MVTLDGVGTPPPIHMELGQIIVGGVGAGMYGMLLFVILAILSPASWWGARPSMSARKSRPRS